MTTLEDVDRRLRQLEDIHAITQLKHRYFRLLDHKQWDELRQCFTEDVESHYESGHYQFRGVDALMTFLSESLDGLTEGGRFALHLGHHPELELTGPDTARGRWTLHAPIVDRSEGRVGRQDSFYQDEYRREDGIWRISRIGYDTYATCDWPAPGLDVRVGAESDTRNTNAGARRRVDAR